MENVRIVLIPVDYHDSRKLCELIQNQSYPSSVELMKEINSHMGEDANEFGGEVLIYALDSFMDEVNDQLLDVLTEYFMSYVKIEG
jgi:hypothetical protein